MLFVILLPFSGSSFANLLTNGNFEQGKTDWKNFGTNRTVLTGSSKCRGGSGRCLKVDGGSYRHVDHINISVSPYQSYDFSGYVKVVNRTSGDFRFLVKWFNGSTLIGSGQEFGRQSSNTSGYVKKTATLKAPSNATRMQIQLVKTKTNTGSIGYFDAITLVTQATTSGGGNNPPTANNDSASTDKNTAVKINVLANDTDSENDVLSVYSVTQGTNGKVTNKGVNVIYTPATGFTGTDSFSYTVSDGNGGGGANDTANVNVKVSSSTTVGNILSNGNFEQGETAWKNLGVNRTVLTGSSKCRGGSGNCLKVDGGSYRYVKHVNISVTPDQSYSFSGYVKVVNRTSGNFKFFVKWFNGSTLIGSAKEFANQSSNTSAYVKKTATLKAPANATWMQIQLVKIASNIGSIGYVDDITVVAQGFIYESSPELIYYNGFESGKLNIRCSGNCPTVSSDYSRAGSFTMKSYLNVYTSSNPFRTEAGEEGRVALQAKLGEERWYGFSVYLPAGYIPDGRQELVAQWHGGNPGPGETIQNPIISLLTANGVWSVINKRDSVVNESGVEHQWHYVDQYQTGVWADWVFHIKWSLQSDGLLEVWKDGVKVVTQYGPNTFKDSDKSYLKLGIYKSGWRGDPAIIDAVTKRTVYHDELRIAGPNGSLSAVSPP